MLSENNSELSTDLKEQWDTYPEYRDVFAAECLSTLKELLRQTDGRAVFIVHPFYLEGTYYQGHLKEAMQGRTNNANLDKFVRKVASILPKLIEAGVPVILLQELEMLGNPHIEDRSDIKTTYDELCERLTTVGDIKPDQLFVFYTQRGGPGPLKSKKEETTTNFEIARSRMRKLREAGVRTGIVAGRDFRPSEGPNSEYYADAANPNYGFGKTAENMHDGRLLKDYYDEQRASKTNKHPLQVIRPDQCVGEFLRMLANNDIRPAISTVTYPDQIGVTSAYTSVEVDNEKVLQKTTPPTR